MIGKNAPNSYAAAKLRDLAVVKKKIASYFVKSGPFYAIFTKQYYLLGI
jgi:hypothetical protein